MDDASPRRIILALKLFTRPSFAARSTLDAIRRDPNYYPQNDPLRWGGGYARDLSGILEPAPPNGAGRLSYTRPDSSPRSPHQEYAPL